MTPCVVRIEGQQGQLAFVTSVATDRLGRVFDVNTGPVAKFVAWQGTFAECAAVVACLSELYEYLEFRRVSIEPRNTNRS